MNNDSLFTKLRQLWDNNQRLGMSELTTNS